MRLSTTLPTTLVRLTLCGALGLLAGCGDDGAHTEDPNEVITTVLLEFVPVGGGTTVTATFDDPDGNGGAPPTIDPLVLIAGTSYALGVRFENRLEDPAEDITQEVRDEAEDHQIFFTGTAVTGPASDRPGAPLTHAYADTDLDGLPVGLESTIAASAGTGDLIVTLRHVPPLNDIATKTAELAEQVRTGGFATVAGSTDAQVTFPVTVN